MQWFEDDTFWATFGPYIFSDERLRAAPHEVEQVLALTGASRPDVLDLCCGTGRHAVAFARKGCRVTAVDRTRGTLERARAYCAEARADVEFVECDMREFTRPASFDLVVNLFTSFGYFETAGEELQVLRNVRDALRPGGAFLLDVMGKEVFARIFQATRSEVGADGTLMIWRTAVTADWTRVKGEWHAVRNGVASRYDVEHWIYSGRELRALLQEAGFRQVRLFGDLDGRPYGLDATRLIAVATA